MIDMKNKKVFSGYGDIAVGVSDDGCLVIHDISPCQEIGENPQKGAEYFDSLKIDIDYQGCLEVLLDLHSVTLGERVFSMGDWEINFEQYNPLSVRSWQRAVVYILNDSLYPKEE